MMDVLSETLGFAAKALIVFLTVAATSLVLFARAKGTRGGAGPLGRLVVHKLNDRMRALSDELRLSMMTSKEFRRHVKSLAKRTSKSEAPRKRVFVLDFKGDVMASRVESLREEVSALSTVAAPGDEVVVRLESPGGAAHSYGLAASQLARLKQRGLKVTACVDKVAASGGYMMACVADEILTAPFAILGSIGVAAPLPNVHRLLDRVGVDYEDVTAGEHKRTVSFLAPISEQGRRKFQEQIEDVHVLFKTFVKEHRPSLDVDTIATGEHWMGTRAVELGLANRLMTSDDYLLSKLDEADLFQVSYQRPRGFRERFASAVRMVATELADAVLERAHLPWRARTL